VNAVYIFIDVSNEKQTDYQSGNVNRNALLENEVINKMPECKLICFFFKQTQPIHTGTGKAKKIE
jgi:hypothetical protein